MQDKKNFKALKYKQKNAEKVIKARRLNKLELIQYKGGKCEICGYNKPFPAVYDFHHINPEQKEFTISKHIGRNIEALKKEADKCQLLCSNCHSEIHDSLNNNQLNKTVAILEDMSYNALEERAKRRRKQKDIKLCKNCSLKFHPKYKTQTFCNKECNLKYKRRNIPNKEYIIELLKTFSFTKVAKMFNVSDNAVRKWIK